MEFKELLEFIKEENVRLTENYYSHYDEEKRVFSATVKLVEEVGELCEEVLKRSRAQRKIKLESEEDIENEVADVLITTLIIAELTGVNPQCALDKKIAKIMSRYDESGKEVASV